MNMKILAFVTPPSIYHGCSTCRMFWEEKFTSSTMKVFANFTVRKHREINDGDKYITIYISLNFGSLDNIKIKSSEPKDYLERSGKGFITSLGLNKIRRSKKIKKERFAITNVSIKEIYNIIKEFEDLPYEGYVRKRSKQMPTDSYFYPVRQLCKVYDGIQYVRWPCKNANE